MRSCSTTLGLSYVLFALTNCQEKESALEKSVNSTPPHASQVHFKRKINIGDFSEQRTLAYELALADLCQKELLKLSAQDEQSLPRSNSHPVSVCGGDRVGVGMGWGWGQGT